MFGTGLILQPIYLGTASQPDRIPLAPAIYNANYDYGACEAIFQPRPCYHGHFLVAGVPEYEQNLAVLFGVSAQFSDTSQLRGTTVTFLLRQGKSPGNAPYSQEQVMAASLQIILMNAQGLSKNAPLTVIVKGDGIATPDWTSKYAKAYFHQEELADQEPHPIILSGLRIEESSLGVRHVVFADVKPDPAIKRRDPVFVPFLLEGECDNDGYITLVPIWYGDTWQEPLNVLTTPYLPYYEMWGGVNGKNSETVAIPHMAPPNPIISRTWLDIDHTASGITVTPHQESFPPNRLAAFIFACVSSTQPTTKCPLTISLHDATIPEEYKAILRTDPAWREGASCDFVCDPATSRLLKGNVPGFVLKNIGGRLTVSMKTRQQRISPNDSVQEWIVGAIQYISNDAPPAVADEITEIKRNQDSLWRDSQPDSKEDDQQRIRSLLALWKFDGAAETLENAWWRSTDRVTRSIAACLIVSKQDSLTGSDLNTLDFGNEISRFNEWEAQRRSEETANVIQDAIKTAVQEWEKRHENAGAKAQD